jgi:hypothetical protein
MAILFTLGLFAVWWLVGLGLLPVVRTDTGSLRIALTAPALGMAGSILLLFVFSHAGVALDDCALPLAIALVVTSRAIVAGSRPRCGVAPVLVVRSSAFAGRATSCSPRQTWLSCPP